MSLHHTFRTWWMRRRTASPALVMPLLAQRSLRVVFQPLVDVRSGVIVGHEALVRAPLDQPDLSAERMLEAAQEEHCQKNFEIACLEQAMAAWVRHDGRGQLLANLSATTLLQLHHADLGGLLLERMRKQGVSARRLGLDISGYTAVQDLAALVAALKPLRAAGVMVALDDFKPSDRGMQAWAKLLPNAVKLAPRWTHNLATEPQQAKTVESMVRLTRKHDSLLVAKAVESDEALRAVAQLGVHWAQGYFLGSPDTTPCRQLNRRASLVLSGVAATAQALATSTAQS